ncbi:MULTISPECIES: flagellar FlbD family protein [Clostridia]|jgi:flagellar protein FlbD|uniref:flagellar FlbD family protein n=1 Tax=Clostridia TaxID=186801 RepID=UPI000E5CA8EB|nr:flagellar FlbD family protein [Eubacterium sp. AF22-9]RGS32848.1 flagellar protein FlbD [Eubacterium sp. AF22-9]HAS07041.1 flagellar protein FlbD [Eubacterium sp.]HCO36445.1 flagellar protein FlbD [Eubacterium sp.]
MIDVTRLNGKNFVLNAELIEVMEETPDTVITLTTGHKYVVKESLDEVLDRIMTYKRNIIGNIQVVKTEAE